MTSKISFVALATILSSMGASAADSDPGLLPTPLGRYHDPVSAGKWDVLVHRAEADPFNIVALIIFVCANLHTFLAARIRHWARVVAARQACNASAPMSFLRGFGDPMKDAT